MTSLSNCLLALSPPTATPEAMMANGGTGSTYFFDNVLSKTWCCCSCLGGETGKKYWHSDMLFGMWFFFLFSVLLTP